jgi:hypothetical protein
MKKIQLSLDINEAHRMIAMLTLGHIVTNSESLLVVKLMEGPLVDTCIAKFMKAGVDDAEIERIKALPEAEQHVEVQRLMRAAHKDMLDKIISLSEAVELQSDDTNEANLALLSSLRFISEMKYS